MKTIVLLFSILGIFLNCASTIAQTMVDDYWPLYDTDLKRYVDDRGHLLRQGVADLGGGDFKVVWVKDDHFGYQIQRRVPSGVMLKHDETEGDGVDFDPPIVLINEALLQHGGSLTTSTTVKDSFDYDAKYKVEVTFAGNVRVQAGVFPRCKNIKITELKRWLGRDIESGKYEAVLAPKVGIIKYKLNGKWWELVNGIVGGLNVENYAMVTSLATIQVQGSGTVTPNYNGYRLYVGTHYTTRATPARGYLFYGWIDSSGNLLSTERSYRFEMQSNLVMQAVFIPTPFQGSKGNYAGLFYNSEQLSQASSGAFSGKLTEYGLFSGRVTLGNGRVYPVSGSFSTNLTFNRVISRNGNSSLVLNLQLDTNTCTMVGSIQADWTSQLTALRTASSGSERAPQVGRRYTLAIPGGADSAMHPIGFGYGTAKVGLLADVVFGGMLADGSAVSQSAPICGNGYWPVCVPLYGSKGLLFGWLQFHANETNDLSGSLNWFRQARAGSQRYAAGFSLTNLNAIGSEYLSYTPVSWTGGMVEMSFANTSEDLFTYVAMSSNGRGQGAGNLSVVINPSTGLFKGSVLHQPEGATLRFNGAYLQKQKTSYGYFLDRNHSGSVVITAQD